MYVLCIYVCTYITLSRVSVMHLLYVHICVCNYVRTNAILALTQILLFRMRVFVWPRSLSLWASCKHTHTRNTPHTPQHMSFIGNIAFVCVCVRVCAHVHIGFYLSPSLFLSLYLSIYLSLSISLSLCTTGQRLVWEYFSFSLSQNLLDHSFGITTLAKIFCVYVYVYVYMYVHVYMYVYVYV